YTDARSPKETQIKAQPQAALVAWCPALQWQLRLRLHVSIETDGLAVSSRWAQLRLRPQAQDYLSPLPPGAPLAGGEAVRDMRGHFALLRARVRQLDWLGLRADGHRRALFDATGARWLNP
ncbi:MAG: pyridoxamine 5'-phosphate oxidase, partial [Inhella sp.]